MSAAVISEGTCPLPHPRYRMPADSFECSVCCDLLVDPVVFPCGHDSCSGCYSKWVYHSSSIGLCAACPLCRTALPASLGVCLRLKHTVESLHPEASEKRRAELASTSSGDPVSKASILPSASAVMAHPYTQWYRYVSEMQSVVAAGMQAPQMWSMPMPVHDSHVCQESPSEPDAASPVGSSPSQLTSYPVLDPMEVLDLSSLTLSSSSATPHSRQTATRSHQNPWGSKWQSTADSGLRLELARNILKIMRSRGGQTIKGDRLLATVRYVEAILYRLAKSKANYLDSSSLEIRVTAVVRPRFGKRLAK
eukprot:gene24551-10162_t